MMIIKSFSKLTSCFGGHVYFRSFMAQFLGSWDDTLGLFLHETGLVSGQDNRDFNGPLGRSLRSFTRTAYSVQKLAHSLHSLPCGTVKIHECEFILSTCSTGTIAFFIFTRNTPSVGFIHLSMHLFLHPPLSSSSHSHINKLGLTTMFLFL